MSIATQQAFSVRPKARLTSEQAQRYGTRLSELAQVKASQRITPEEVVEEGRKKDSPLHDWFEWRDGMAAEEYRLVQARYLLRSIEVVVERESEPLPVRAFVYVKELGEEGEDDSGYVPVQYALSDEQRYAAVLQSAYGEYRALYWKHRHLKELRALFPLDAMQEWDQRFGM